MSKKLKQNSAWYPSTSQPDDRVLNRADIPSPRLRHLSHLSRLTPKAAMELPADIWTKMVLPALACDDRWALGRCSKELLKAADKLDRDEGRQERMVFITDVACNEERMAWAIIILL